MSTGRTGGPATGKRSPTPAHPSGLTSCAEIRVALGEQAQARGAHGDRDGLLDGLTEALLAEYPTARVRQRQPAIGCVPGRLVELDRPDVARIRHANGMLQKIAFRK